MRKHLALTLALALTAAFAGPASAHGPDDEGVLDPIVGDHQHGGTEGHLPPVNKKVDVVGKLDLFGGDEEPGRIADVAAFGNYAYLGAFAKPNCENGGVYVVDIKDPTAPKEAAFIPTSPATFVGEGVQVLDMSTASFKGQVLIHNNETCIPGGGAVTDDPRFVGGPGGTSMWDVTNPEDPKPLKLHFGDTDPPAAGQLPSGVPHNSHSAFGWQQGDRAYVVMYDNGESGRTDIDIWDITDPRNPTFVLETGAAHFGGEISEDPAPNGNSAKLHDMVVKQVNGRYLMLASYWDGGYVILDVTDIGNASLSVQDRAKFLRDTDFGAIEPFSTELGLPAGLPPEGNAHQAEFNRDGSLFLGADEDFNASRFLASITTGRYAGDRFTATEGSNTPPVDREKGLAGPTKFLGQGCGTVTPAPTPTTIALMERGACTFTIKVQSAEAAGYAAAVVFNDAATDAGTTGKCEAHVFMLAVGRIPSMFVSRSVGLKLMNQDVGENSCTTATPPPQTPSEAFEMKPVFDGWGYLHLYDANTMQAIDHWAIPESLDATKAEGSGDLTIHEVAMDPSRNLAYISYYSGGFRVVKFSAEEGITEVGAFIDEGGNNLWGVEVHTMPATATKYAGQQVVLASDRDSGLYIFQYKAGGKGNGKGNGKAKP